MPKLGRLQPKSPWTEWGFLCYIATMNIEVKLYAHFKHFLPSGTTTFSSFDQCCAGEGMVKSLGKETTVEELVKELGIPEDIPKIVIVNDGLAEFDCVLKDGDRVSVFPPLAGG